MSVQPPPNVDPARFAEVGYCLFRRGLSAAEVACYSRLLDDLLAGRGKLGEPHYFSDDWRALCCHPRILDGVEAVLGTPEIVLFFSSLFVKTPNDRRRVDWHQDNTYWPSVSGQDVVTVWVALDDVDERNSCMRVIPRSHAGYRAMDMIAVEEPDGAMLSRRVDVTPSMVDAAVPMVLMAGEFSVHDSFLVHGSSPNHGDSRRAGYTIRYGNALTTAIDPHLHTYGDLPQLPVYYVRGDGSGRQPGWLDERAVP